MNEHYVNDRFQEAAIKQQQAMSKGYADTAPRNQTPTEEAEVTLKLAHALNSIADDLEHRLFGPRPQDNCSAGEDKQASGLEHTIRAARQRLETATSRFSLILARL